jgi:HTH-type transcriptional regulator/antitoxin HipB
MDYPLQGASRLSAHRESQRKAKGLSQKPLEQLLGLGQVRVADIEKNPGVVSLDQLLRILHCLDARLAWKPPAVTPPADSPVRPFARKETGN